MMRSIHLYGALKKQFGPKHRFDVLTAAEALRALNCAFPGQFVAALQVGSYKLVRGALRTGMNISDIGIINELRLGMADLHLVPVAQGAISGKGVAQTVLGAALIGGAIFMSGGTLAAPLAASGLLSGITWGNIAAIGLGVALAGASTLLAKPASTIDNEKDQSRNFSGISANGNQGDAIPLIYGRTLVPGTPISFEIDIEDTFVYNGGDAWGSLPNGPLIPGLFGSP
jgi:predicted phage tail protein